MSVEGEFPPAPPTPESEALPLFAVDASAAAPVPTPESANEQPPAPSRPRSVLVLLLWTLAVAYGLFICGGHVHRAALLGLLVLPFVMLTYLAYKSVDHLWARIVTPYYLLLLVLFSGAVIQVVAAEAQPTGEQAAPLRVLLVFLAPAVSALCLAPAVRRAFSLVTPLDSQSVVHATALSTVVGLTLVFLMPLLMTGEAPLLAMLQQADSKNKPDDEADTELNKSGAKDTPRDETLADQFYTLAWSLPAAFLAVGWPGWRNFAEARLRLGLLRPRRRQVGLALVVAAVLIPLTAGTDALTEWFWQACGWQATDTRAMQLLFRSAATPIGAAVIGITAGLGEEVLIRGVLQPRLGIWLSNLFFTSLHALQYNFDALLGVFLLGLVLGIIRKRTNTSTSAIVHGVYDFFGMLLLIADMTGSP
jgi:membrane protease YdiL (CAAX protease family)